jgi:hypothetical protein
MIRKILFFLFLIILLSSFSAYSQDTIRPAWDGFLESAGYARPFISEMHSTVSKVELGYNKSYAEFNLLEQKSSFDRPMVELHVGFDAPIYAISFGTIGNKPKWGLAVSLPLSVHVLEDMFDPVTAPVINTDYRFGSARIRAIRNFSGNDFIKNISFSWLPIFHECTHLGDEIIIYRMNDTFPITRINVSYEYTEFQITINDPDADRETRHSFRLGGLYRISSRGLGWFSVRKGVETLSDLNIPASNYRAEYYAEYQYQRTRGFLASKRFVNLISFEVRNRLRYGYPLYKKVDNVWETTEIKEKMQLNFNLYLGYKFYPRSNNTHSIGLFLHGYRGLNPYGQLRNYPGYPFFGLSLTYEP